MSELYDVLSRVSDDLQKGRSSPHISVRELIRLAGGDRRTLKVSFFIASALAKFNLATEPGFNTVPLDSTVSLVVRGRQAVEDAGLDADSENIPVEEALAGESLPSKYVSGAVLDPSFRISRLPASETRLISVKPDDTLTHAVTLMLSHDYSQLPVMTGERDVKGVISWESIGRNLVLAEGGSRFVRDFMGLHKEVLASESIFKAIPQIVEHSYVLVRGGDKRVTGIITTVDLSVLLQQLSEPFLLLSEIENHIRKLIDGRFTKVELASIVATSDAREVEAVSDLTFGEYIRLLQVQDNWDRLGLKIDRVVFVGELDKVRIIRNNVMHFDPDGISSEDHRLLHQFVRFMQQVQVYV